MRPAENMKKLIKNVPIKTNAERDKKVFDDVLNALEKSERDHLAVPQSRIWRTIMRNRITKLTAAVFFIAAFVGVYQLGGPLEAFAHTTRVVRTTLADLREFASNLREREPERHIYESNLPPAEPARPNPDIQYTIISARVQEFSAVGGQDDLLDFPEAKGVELDPVGDYQDISYARLDPDKAEYFTDFAGANDLKLMSSFKLMLREDHEGTVGSFGAEGQDAVALALAATVLDDDGLVELSFSFLHGQSGFEMPSLEIEADEAVLFRLVGTAETEDNSNDKDAPDSDSVIFVLIRIEVIPPG
jgi:hypothetical protein